MGETTNLNWYRIFSQQQYLKGSTAACMCGFLTICPPQTMDEEDKASEEL